LRIFASHICYGRGEPVYSGFTTHPWRKAKERRYGRVERNRERVRERKREGERERERGRESERETEIETET